MGKHIIVAVSKKYFFLKISPKTPFFSVKNSSKSQKSQKSQKI
jgi:hypothetical protein